MTRVGVDAGRGDAVEVLLQRRDREPVRRSGLEHRERMRVERARDRGHPERPRALDRGLKIRAWARWIPSKEPRRRDGGASSDGKDGRPRRIRMEESLRFHAWRRARRADAREPAVGAVHADDPVAVGGRRPGTG